MLVSSTKRSGTETRFIPKRRAKGGCGCACRAHTFASPRPPSSPAVQACQKSPRISHWVFLDPFFQRAAEVSSEMLTPMLRARRLSCSCSSS
ncbi:MAG: hypothetical protein HC765_15520 [Brachymonas sp.]|nr:hypothetical protein [Brachymonas sp.]